MLRRAQAMKTKQTVDPFHEHFLSARRKMSRDERNDEDYYFSALIFKTADQGNAEAQFHSDILLSRGDGNSKNQSLAANSFTYATVQNYERVQFVSHTSHTSQSETDVTKDHLSCHERYLFEAKGERSDEREEENGAATIETGIRLSGESGLNHLKIGADAGITNAEFHSHMSLDEQTMNCYFTPCTFSHPGRRS
jgi:hypothetical protein